MDFVVIDFETATSERHNPCEIGITLVENDIITETVSYLIKPPCFPNFAPWNVRIHGITPNDVSDAMTFDVLWKDIKYFFEKFLVVAHNVQFDRSVLEKTLEHYDIPIPQYDWFCSLEFAKYHYPDAASHKLESLCEERKIEYNAHRAGADSEATAKVLLQMLWEQKIDDLSKLIQSRQIIEPQKSEGRFIPFAKRLYKVKTDSAVASVILDLLDELGIDNFEILRQLAESVKQQPGRKQWAEKLKKIDDKPPLVYFGAEPNPESPFFEKTVVFTQFSTSREGELGSIVKRIGGTIGNGITKKTDFLVIADENANDIFDSEKQTGKMKKALEYQQKEISIAIISESEFLAEIKANVRNESIQEF